jgi:hypothetical protein
MKQSRTMSSAAAFAALGRAACPPLDLAYDRGGRMKLSIKPHCVIKT